MPAPDPAEAADLLRRILDHDRDVDLLEAEIGCAEVELRDLKKRLTIAVLARDKLSRDLREPKPLLGGVAETSDTPKRDERS